MFYTYSEDLSEQLYTHWENSIVCKGSPNNIPFGNGGISIRNTEKMALICELEDSNNNEAEDFYFSRFLRKYDANLPTLNEARSFACETDYFQGIGCHQSYKFLNAEDQAKIYERHFKHLIALIEASS